MRSIALAGALLLLGCQMSQESAPPKGSTDPYVITVDYGNAVQGNLGWRCTVRHFREDEVREYRIGFLGERDSAMDRDPEEVVLLLIVARSEGDLSNPLAQLSYMVMPGGALMPVGGSDWLASDRLVPPDALGAEQVEAATAFARRWIERVSTDPTREVLEERFEGPPEGWPL